MLHSASAFLQSIIPDPVLSRSDFTSFAEIPVVDLAAGAAASAAGAVAATGLGVGAGGGGAAASTTTGSGAGAA